MLTISLFGPFDVKRDGASVRTTWTRQAHRLLALLALNHNRTLSTDWVINALMLPESVLPQSLVQIYEALGQQDRKRLEHKNRQLYLETSGIDIDLDAFNRCIEKGSRDSHLQAVRLFNGGLLRDWEEEGWFAEERESCLADYLDAMNSLVKACMAEEDFETAASYLRRHTAAMPEMDGYWTRLVEACRLGGNLAGVHESYSRYLTALMQRGALDGRRYQPSRRFMDAFTAATTPNSNDSISPQMTSTTFNPNPVHPVQFLATGISDAVAAPVGGAVPYDSPLYIERTADELARVSLERRSSFILVKGPRQVGKSSLAARAIAQARNSGVSVVRTDWQKMPQAALASDRAFLNEIAGLFADHLDLAADPAVYLDSPRSPIGCFERYLMKEALPAVSNHLLWVIDEADRIFETPFRDDIFAMLRSWHGERAVDPDGPWRRITVMLVYATEAYLFISNMDQSPFNVGERITLADFNRPQIAQLNLLYGSPLVSDTEIDQLIELVGGHPYLLRRALQAVVQAGAELDTLIRSALDDDGIFGDHLARLWLTLQRDDEMKEAARICAVGGKPPPLEIMLRMRAAGLVTGESQQAMKLRCALYRDFLRLRFG